MSLICKYLVAICESGLLTCGGHPNDDAQPEACQAPPQRESQGPLAHHTCTPEQPVGPCHAEWLRTGLEALSPPSVVVHTGMLDGTQHLRHHSR